MCMMCLKTVVEASVVSGAAVISGLAFLKTKYHLHKMSKMDKNGNCNCGCHCSCHQKECGCDCHKGKEKSLPKKGNKRIK